MVVALNDAIVAMVVFVSVVACIYPPWLLRRVELIETRDLLFLPHDAGRLSPLIWNSNGATTLKIQAHRRYLLVFIVAPCGQNPTPGSDGRDSHRRHPYWAREGERGGGSAQVGAENVLFSLGGPAWDQVCIFRKLFSFFFFLVNMVPLLLTGKGRILAPIFGGHTNLLLVLLSKTRRHRPDPRHN